MVACYGHAAPASLTCQPAMTGSGWTTCSVGERRPAWQSAITVDWGDGPVRGRTMPQYAAIPYNMRKVG